MRKIIYFVFLCASFLAGVLGMDRDAAQATALVDTSGADRTITVNAEGLVYGGPLVFTDLVGNGSDVDQIAHYSHYSHRSHTSHYSHRSHTSHYSSRF